MSAPVILYDNVFTCSTPVANDMATGYAAANVSDYRSYTTWKASAAGVKLIVVDAGAEYTVTLANTRLSLESGRAFIDLTGVDLSSHVGKRITVEDSAGKTLVGWIKAAGSGVSYGTELLTNGGFSSATTSWTGVNGTLASVAGGQSGNCCEITRTGEAYQQALQTVAGQAAGRLYKLSAYVKSGTSGNEGYLVGFYYDSPDGWQAASGTSSASWVLATHYSVPPSGEVLDSVFLHKNTATAGTMLFDTVSLLQVLTPSRTGATIVSARGGTTYSWASEEAGFNRNDSSGYTVTIAAAANAAGLVGHNLWTAGVAFSIESSDDNLSWTERLTPAIPSSDKTTLRTFTEAVARYWQARMATGDAAPEIGELFLGAVLTFPKAPDRPVTPAVETVEAETVIGKTGHILGSIRRHVKVAATPTWSNIQASWVAGDFRAFWDNHAKYLYPFIWAWDLTNYPADVYWMAPKDSATWQAPMGVSTYVNQISLPMVGIAED